MNARPNRWDFALLAIVLLGALLFIGVLGANAQGDAPGTDPPPVTVTPPSEQTISELGTVVIGLLMAFVAGGATVGGGLILFTRRLREQPELARAIERLYLSIPAEQRQPVRDIILGGKEGFELAGDLTDGDLNTPVSDPPQQE